MSFWTPEMQSEIARHNVGWACGKTDFGVYLRASSVRFWNAYSSLGPGVAESVCDIGGFWGVWPLTLRALGHTNVSMTEAMKYYSDAFTPLFDHIRSKGVHIIDVDVFDSSEPMTQLPVFHHLTLLAVLEHIPHSLASPLHRVKAMLSPGGRLYIEVPNIAYWPKRIDLMRGRSPLPPIEDVYNSDTPFIGHHHEYTRQELERLCAMTGLRVVGRRSFNYSWSTSRAGRVVDLVRHPVSSFAFMWPETREVLSVLCEDADL